MSIRDREMVNEVMVRDCCYLHLIYDLACAGSALLLALDDVDRAGRAGRFEFAV
jgi:hypothetical protein